MTNPGTIDPVIWLNNAAAVGSVVSAVIASWQAYRAKSFRDEARVAKTKVMLNELMIDGSHARREARRLTPGQPIRGVNINTIIDTIRNFAERVRDHRHWMGDAAPKLLVDVEKNVTNFVQAGPDSRPQIGDALYNSVCSLTSEIKRVMDADD